MTPGISHKPLTATMALFHNFRSAKGAEFQHGKHIGCLKGTRGTVLDGIELWARDFNQRSIYWLNGLAGTGKSTIAKTVAERLVADGRLGASFFCSREFEDRRNLELIFPTLAIQLARRFTDFRSILVPLIQPDTNIAYEPLYNQMEKLIAQPLKESGISTVIVIDALDECEDEEPASTILYVLGQWAPAIPKVKFFITGRPEPCISKGFRLPLLANITDRFVLHEVEPNQVNHDIQLFFKHSFLELSLLWPGLDDWPTKEQLDELCKRATGLFVYAAAAVKFISNNQWNPKKQLEILLDSLETGAYEWGTLDSLYSSILQQAFSRRKPEDYATVRSTLSAVILAANPLSPSTIAELLGFNAEDVSHLLSLVNSLLIFQDSDHPVWPFHKSFPDFITNPSRCLDMRFCISPGTLHLEFTRNCLRLMKSGLKQNPLSLPNYALNSEVKDLDVRIKDHISIALEYACQYWHSHLTRAADDVGSVIFDLRFFLEENFLTWLEVLSVLGAVRGAVAALKNLIQWLEKVYFDLSCSIT